MCQTRNNGREDSDIKKRIAQYTNALVRALGGGVEASGSGHSFLGTDSDDRNDWDKMAQWLKDQRAIYERVLVSDPTFNND